MYVYKVFIKQLINKNKGSSSYFNFNFNFHLLIVFVVDLCKHICYVLSDNLSQGYVHIQLTYARWLPCFASLLSLFVDVPWRIEYNNTRKPASPMDPV